MLINYWKLVLKPQMIQEEVTPKFENNRKKNLNLKTKQIIYVFIMYNKGASKCAHSIYQNKAIPLVIHFLEKKIKFELYFQMLFPKIM